MGSGGCLSVIDVKLGMSNIILLPTQLKDMKTHVVQHIEAKRKMFRSLRAKLA